MKFMMIVEDPDIARFVSQNGVDRLFVDLEINGKQERQGHLPSWISKQTMETVSEIRAAGRNTHLLVRVNPLHGDSQAEIDDVISRGADSVMLPMFHTIDEVAQFLDMLAGRAIAIPLVETASALAAVPEMLTQLSLSELYVGLNDLHLDMGLDFMFEPLANGVLEVSCKAMREADLPFGIGGLARAGEGIVSPEYLLGEHVRLGSSRAILSRTFHRNSVTLEDIKEKMDFSSEIEKLLDIYNQFLDASSDELEHNRIATADKIQDVVRLVTAKRDQGNTGKPAQ